MLQKFKITSYAIIFFLFLIPFGLATAVSDDEIDWHVTDEEFQDMTAKQMIGVIRQCILMGHCGGAQTARYLDELENHLDSASADETREIEQNQMKWTMDMIGLSSQLTLATS
jgi:hypothetical protein